MWGLAEYQAHFLVWWRFFLDETARTAAPRLISLAGLAVASWFFSSSFGAFKISFAAAAVWCCSQLKGRQSLRPTENRFAGRLTRWTKEITESHLWRSSCRVRLCHLISHLKHPSLQPETTEILVDKPVTSTRGCTQSCAVCYWVLWFCISKHIDGSLPRPLSLEIYWSDARVFNL